ncbi:hypothetical protein D6D28_03812 [Aureobasidium pullulans]|uniref:Uncharacterized protein n=2 Tax=Aureobasidium pullulans TaxID=5580 RepID=A0A4S8SPE3_AURPU|nr:hypothetical protein D6D28_03812 [Aureobasidium pullulans]
MRQFTDTYNMPAFGRGGAGNIEALQATKATKASNATNEKVSADLERNQQDAEDYAGTAHPALHNQEFAHTGRGGAGNYYSPRELIATGKFEGVDTSHVLGDGTPAPKGEKEKEEPTVVRYGRGGMGNFFGVDEEMATKLRKKHEDEARKQEDLKQQIEKGVDGMLSRPEKARLPGGEPF